MSRPDRLSAPWLLQMEKKRRRAAGWARRLIPPIPTQCRTRRWRSLQLSTQHEARLARQWQLGFRRAQDQRRTDGRRWRGVGGTSAATREARSRGAEAHDRCRDVVPHQHLTRWEPSVAQVVSAPGEEATSHGSSSL
jgi:hypothetical protein